MIERFSDEAKKVLGFHGAETILKLHAKNKILPEDLPELFQCVRKDFKDDWLSNDSKNNARDIIVNNSDMFLRYREPPRMPLPDHELKKLFGELPSITSFMMPSVTERREQFFLNTRRLDICICRVTHVLEEEVMLLSVLGMEAQPNMRVDDLSIACFMFPNEKPSENFGIGSCVRGALINFKKLKNSFELSCKAIHLPEAARNAARLGVITEDEIPVNYNIWQKSRDDWSKMMTKSVDDPSLLRKQMEALGIDPYGNDTLVPSLANVKVGETLADIRKRKEIARIAETKKKIARHIKDEKFIEALELVNTITPEYNAKDLIVLKGIVLDRQEKFDEAIECLDKVRKNDAKNPLWVKHGKNALLHCHRENVKRFNLSGEFDRVLKSVMSAQSIERTDRSMFEMYKMILNRLQQRSFLIPLGEDKPLEDVKKKNEAVEDERDKPSTSGTQKKSSEAEAYGPLEQTSSRSSKRPHSSRSNSSSSRSRRRRRRHQKKPKRSSRHHDHRRSPSTSADSFDNRSWSASEELPPVVADPQKNLAIQIMSKFIKK